MSLTKYHLIKCACGEELDVELISSINAAQNPELKECILSGEMNIVKCGSCFKIFYADVFVLYIDIPQEIIAFIYPSSDEREDNIIREKTEIEFKSICSATGNKEKINFEPMVFFGMDTFSEFLKLESEVEDEIEIVKFICRNNKLSIKCISKSNARKFRIPFVLPLLQPEGKNGKDAMDSIIAGLNEVLKVCPELTSYSIALQKIANDPSITLPRLRGTAKCL